MQHQGRKKYSSQRSRIFRPATGYRHMDESSEEISEYLHPIEETYSDKELNAFIGRTYNIQKIQK